MGTDRRRLCILLLAGSGLGSAHPMGNFSISHYSGITIERGRVKIRYFLDVAEIPTFQEMQESGISGADDPALKAYLSRKAAAFERGLRVSVNSRPVHLRAATQNVIFTPGAGGLPTMKFGFVYYGQVHEDCAAQPCRLEYQDTNLQTSNGWKEIIVNAGSEISLANSTAPHSDRSQELSNYPTDLLNSPPQSLQATAAFSAPHELTAAVRKAPVPPTAAPVPLSLPPKEAPLPIQPNQQATPRNAFTQLIARKQLTWSMALFAALIAASLGAVHALEPGHGKTIVAAYLVGSRGTARHALLLGAIVTISHTAGVYLLGAITLYLQKYILPEKLYPFLGVLSGVLIAGMGLYLFLKHYLGEEFAHSHTHGPVSSRQLALLGVTGGLVPCPAALVVLLSAVALHRVVFGLYLIVAFSLGLASVLIAMGLSVVYASRVMSRMRAEGPLIQRWLPLGSAAMIALLGCGIALQALLSAGILKMRM